MNYERLNIGWIQVVGLVGMLVATGLSAQPNADLLQHIDRTLEHEIEEIMAIRNGGGSGVSEREDIDRPLDLSEDPWGGNKATSERNPLVTPECRERAMRDAVHDMAEMHGIPHEEAEKKAKAHGAERQKMFREADISYSEYIQHIAECKALCGNMVKDMIGCHVIAVTGLEHDLAFFSVNRYDVTDPNSLRAVDRIADLLKRDYDKHALLIGRASRTGPLGYNRRLSGLRARAVGEKLAERGIGTERIRTLAFGYEPPQIDRPIADAYRLLSLYDRIGNHKMNQSVMMIVY